MPPYLLLLHPDAFYLGLRKLCEEGETEPFRPGDSPSRRRPAQTLGLKNPVPPDYYIAISSAVRDRIRRIYGFDAEVIFPPVAVNQYQPTSHWDNFYLIVSRLNSYKRIDLAVETFNRLGLPLKIIGSGPFLDPLKRMAKSNVTFLGRIDDRELRDYYAHCKALIFPGEEDFGIARSKPMPQEDRSSP